MTKETKVTDRNGDERIIKRSKMKIIIITLVILIILSLIGVGIYFIVKAAKTNEIDEDNWTVASIEDVRDDILEGDDQIGVFFYKNDSRVTNFMLRDDTNFENGDKGTGVLSEFMASTANEITWYGVEIPEEDNELIETLLTTNRDGELDEYIFYDEFEYLTAGTSLRSEMWAINSLSGVDNDADENFSVDDKKVESFSLSVQTNDVDEDDKNANERDVLFIDSSTSGGGDGSTDGGDGSDGGDTGTETPTKSNRAAGLPYSVQEGTTMFFNGTQLTSIVNGWEVVDVTDPEDAEEGDESAETRDEYHNEYAIYLQELADHNSEFWT